MGKKMGINTKAVEAREKKDLQKRARNEAIERRKADEYWKDDDKQVNRKLERQKEREQKAMEERVKKAANKEAYERDMEQAEISAKSKSTKHQTSSEPKVTRNEIQKKLDEDQSKQISSKVMKNVHVAPIALVPNLNRLDDGENASSIDQALDLLRADGPASMVSVAPSSGAKTRKL